MTNIQRTKHEERALKNNLKERSVFELLNFFGLYEFNDASWAVAGKSFVMNELKRRGIK